jgi:hypothetical protein
MKYVLTTFISIILLGSCSFFQTSKSDEGLSCRKFEKFIVEAWKYDDTKKIFVFESEDAKFFNKHKTCLYGKSANEIIELLGEPSKKGEYVLRYYTDARCNKKPQKFCVLIQIKIDNNTKKVFNVVSSGYRKY